MGLEGRVMKNELVGAPEKRRQHYLPRFFLKGFTDDGRHLNCLRRREDGTLQFLPNQSIDNVCAQRDLYETRLGNKDATCIFPNGLEDTFSAMESKISAVFLDAVGCIRTIKTGDYPEEMQLDDIACKLSAILAWLTYRNPSVLEDVLKDTDIALSAFEKYGLGTEENLKSFFKTNAGFCGEIPAGVFVPDMMAELVMKYFELVPPSGVDPEIASKASVFRLAEYLRNCSMFVLVSDDGHPFAGLDFPTNIVLDTGIAAHYWPIAGDIAISFIDDGAHMFKLRLLTSQETCEWNEFGVVNGPWKVAFCADDSTLRAIQGKMEGHGEQDR